MTSTPDSQGWVFRWRYSSAFLAWLSALVVSFVASHDGPAPSVEAYYGSWESRIDYRLILGNTRHCGLYAKGQLNPFPISTAQRAMEDKLYERLGLKPSAKVLDAGAGSGYVAMTMARHGLEVQAIDITSHYLADARKNVKKYRLENKISVDYANYHNLSAFPDASFDGIYTMETFVHADDPLKVLTNFKRLLNPGGVLVLHEADFDRDSKTLQDLLDKAGYKDFSIEDLTDEVLPMWRFFGIIGYIPYQIFKLLGIQDRFINVMAGVEAWLN